MRKYLYICSRNITFKVFISMGKKEYINEDGCINFEKFDLLNESEQLNEQSTWNDQQWWQFFSRGGTLTHEEFCLKLDKIIQDVYGD